MVLPIVYAVLPTHSVENAEIYTQLHFFKIYVQMMCFFTLCIAQCEKLSVFLLLGFYVKSKLCRRMKN